MTGSTSDPELHLPRPLVLVVDDEAVIQSIVCEVLSTEEVEVHSAASVQEAIAVLTDNSISLIISDIMMPEATGIDLLEWMRKTDREIPVIFMTGYPTAELTVKALNLGAHHFLAKPFSSTQLLKAVRSSLAAIRENDIEREYQERLRRELETVRQKYVDEVVQNEVLYMAILTSLANALDARDSYTHRHSSSVAEYARATGAKMSLPEDELAKLYNAGRLHDIGKIGISETILLKPGSLNEKEFEIIKTHSSSGAQILAPLPKMEEVIMAVRHHHEKYDGTGYPDGLAEEEIPVMARILAVCDTWDAMTTNRPYRDAIQPGKAREIIKEERGRQFDPVVVDAFFLAEVLP